MKLDDGVRDAGVIWFVALVIAVAVGQIDPLAWLERDDPYADPASTLWRTSTADVRPAARAGSIPSSRAVDRLGPARTLANRISATDGASPDRPLPPPALGVPGTSARSVPDEVLVPASPSGLVSAPPTTITEPGTAATEVKPRPEPARPKAEASKTPPRSARAKAVRGDQVGPPTEKARSGGPEKHGHKRPDTKSPDTKPPDSTPPDSTPPDSTPPDTDPTAPESDEADSDDPKPDRPKPDPPKSGKKDCAAGAATASCDKPPKDRGKQEG